MSAATVLIDTNLLVYAQDREAEVKHERALSTLKALTESRSAVLSAQVVGEFYSVMTRKLRRVMSEPDAFRAANAARQAWSVLPVTDDVIAEALRGARSHQLSYYDAQIWAVAKLERIPFVLTEGFSDKRLIEGVRFVDPFAEGFDASRLVSWSSG
jgi:predicted nucleic acid-binding protein